MSKYKVGDKVVVRKDLEVGYMYGELLFTSDMEKHRGKEVVIRFDADGDYYIEGDEDCSWTDEMFEDSIEFPEGSIVTYGDWYRKVLGVCGEVRFISQATSVYTAEHNCFNCYSKGMTVQDLKDGGYEIYTHEAHKPKLTHKQLEEKLGYEFELEEGRR